MLGSEKTAPPPSIDRASSNIYSLNERRNADVIAAAELLLAGAKSGRISGFAYVAQVDGRDQPLAITGSYLKDAFAFRGLICALYEFAVARFR